MRVALSAGHHVWGDFVLRAPCSDVPRALLCSRKLVECAFAKADDHHCLPALVSPWDLAALLLSGRELILQASVRICCAASHGELVEMLGLLRASDMSFSDHGHCSAFWVGPFFLIARGIGLGIRCDEGGGWNTAQAFLRPGTVGACARLRAAVLDAERECTALFGNR